MQVILTQDVKTQGKKGDSINVSDGYARNFLFPKGLAIAASKENINSLKGKKDAEKYKKDMEMQNARELSEKLSNITVEITAKAGENGKLFGSITTMEIVDKLKYQHHIVIDKRKVVLGDPIKHLGTFELDVKLYPEVITLLKVLVKAE